MDTDVLGSIGSPTFPGACGPQSPATDLSLHSCSVPEPGDPFYVKGYAWKGELEAGVLGSATNMIRILELATDPFPSDFLHL